MTFGLSSLSMTDPLDLQDATVTVSAGRHDAGDLPGHHDAAPPADANSNDESGTASVDVVIPAGTPAGAVQLLVTGATTGTVSACR